MSGRHRFRELRRDGDPVVPLRGRGGFGAQMVPAQLQVPGPEWVALASIGGTEALSVLALLSGDPTPFGGGGIEPDARPGRRPLTPYIGTEAPGIALPLLLDGHSENESVEDACRAIERMAGMFVPDDPGPQKLYVHGPSVPHCRGTEYLRHHWLISEPPDWDAEMTIRKRSGARVRQQVTLTLLLSTEADELERVKPRQPKPDYKVRTAHAGDTYLKFARRELGSERYGRRLALLNGDKDPNKKLREGQKVRMPSPHLLAAWKRELHVKG